MMLTPSPTVWYAACGTEPGHVLVLATIEYFHPLDTTSIYPVTTQMPIHKYWVIPEPTATMVCRELARLIDQATTSVRICLRRTDEKPKEHTHAKV